jgi:hypothetical protein
MQLQTVLSYGYIYDIILENKHKLYGASGSPPPPPQVKHSGAHLYRLLNTTVNNCCALSLPIVSGVINIIQLIVLHYTVLLAANL